MGSVTQAKSMPSVPMPPGHLSGICHLVGPGGGDLSENLCPGVRHLSILLEALFNISLKKIRIWIALDIYVKNKR